MSDLSRDPAGDTSLFGQIQDLATEQRNPSSQSIDSVSIAEALEIINTEDHCVPIAVRREIPYITKAVEIVVDCLRSGGRLLYVGAGTSGRLGILDASECPPTYGTPPSMVQGLIAGGPQAVSGSLESAEDVPEHGGRDLEEAGLKKADVVCGIAASSRTPYVLGAVNHAREKGCKTLFISCTPRSQLDITVDVPICPVVGPEVIMGSTRMKSGTAQKLVLNMITTVSMIQLGKVYENMMVDLQMSNEKLVERSKRIVMIATGVSYEEADGVLEKADGHVKTALVMILGEIDAEAAQKRLAHADGFVREAVGNLASNGQE